jgi:hypothetical protein
MNDTKITGQSKFIPAKAWNMTAHQLEEFFGFTTGISPMKVILLSMPI